MGGGQTSKGKGVSEIPVVRLCIKSQDGFEDYYKVGRNTDIKKLLKTYCKDKELEYHYINFLHDGARLSAGGTIDELGIKDGDQIDAMTSQTGGGHLRRLLEQEKDIGF